MSKLKDSDLMPWGVHKGKKIGDVPFDYLLRFYRKQWLGGEVKEYFEKQLKIIEQSEVNCYQQGLKKPKKYIIEDYECTYPYKTKTNKT